MLSQSSFLKPIGSQQPRYVGMVALDFVCMCMLHAYACLPTVAGLSLGHNLSWVTSEWRFPKRSQNETKELGLTVVTVVTSCHIYASRKLCGRYGRLWLFFLVSCIPTLNSAPCLHFLLGFPRTWFGPLLETFTIVTFHWCIIICLVAIDFVIHRVCVCKFTFWIYQQSMAPPI